MPLSISSSTNFSNINWDDLENRPVINKSMTFCEEKDWYNDAKCCMDSYSIEHVLDVAHTYDLRELPEVKFLEEYPCLNGLELDSLADKIAAYIPDSNFVSQEDSWPSPQHLQANQAILLFVQLLKKLICSE